MRFHDTRKFGKMYLLKKDELLVRKPLSELGLEPFDEHLNRAYLRQKYLHKSLPIKTVLLDQQIIVGIGNIYADEILFLAHINPYRKAKSLKLKELELIIDNTKKVLTKAIALGGTTIRSYVSLDNKKGAFQDELMVHGRVNQPCKICGTLIKKEFIGGRGSYYCPTCQK
jgi:formamidopyrimidine-DNA glycosylase